MKRIAAALLAGAILAGIAGQVYADPPYDTDRNRNRPVCDHADC